MNERENHLINLIAERDAEIERLKDALKAKGTPGAAGYLSRRYGVTPNEARLLEILSDGNIWDFGPISKRLAGGGLPVAKATLRVTMAHVREKLNDCGSKIDMIYIYRRGYQIIGGLDELRAAMKPPVEMLNTIDDERLR